MAAAWKFIVRDNNDKCWGPFDSADAAVTWAREKWPNRQWEVEALWTP